MKIKEMLEKVNTLTNKVSDLEVQAREMASECRRILFALEELPSEVDEIDFQESKEDEEESSTTTTEDFEPDELVEPRTGKGSLD